MRPAERVAVRVAVPDPEEASQPQQELGPHRSHSSHHRKGKKTKLFLKCAVSFETVL